MRVKSAATAMFLAALFVAGIWHYTERTRVIEGTWLYMFEGSEFFEELRPGQECDLYRDSGSWLDYSPKSIYPDYTYKRSYLSSGMYRNVDGEWRLEAFQLRFVGRRRFAPFGAGHFGLWTSEYEVDKMLSVKPVPNLDCNAP